MSGLEVSYEHYKGSYSRRVMYTPVALSVVLAAAGTSAFFSRRAARTVLPAISAITLADCGIGFYFHVRGIARKPGGWGLPITNIVMGPPLFAPLLFGTSAYLGMVAAFLGRPEQDATRQHARERGFQKHIAVAAAVATSLSGLEAWYSHYKNNFQYRVQWTPLIVAPILVAASIGAVSSPRIARTLLPAASFLAIADGTVGSGYHLRGLLRRSGGRKKLLYNIMYGPPIFAPLLLAASGFLGILASLLGKHEP